MHETRVQRRAPIKRTLLEKQEQTQPELENRVKTGNRMNTTKTNITLSINQIE